MTGGKPKLKKSYRIMIEEARRHAARSGATVEYDLDGGKHPMFIVSRRGQETSVSFPSSPRADNYKEYARSAITRALRRLDARQ